MQLSSTMLSAVQGLNNQLASSTIYAREFRFAVFGTATFDNISDLVQHHNEELSWASRYVANFMDMNTNIYTLGLVSICCNPPNSTLEFWMHNIFSAPHASLPSSYIKDRSTCVFAALLISAPLLGRCTSTCTLARMLHASMHPWNTIFCVDGMSQCFCVSVHACMPAYRAYIQDGQPRKQHNTRFR